MGNTEEDPADARRIHSRSGYRLRLRLLHGLRGVGGGARTLG